MSLAILFHCLCIQHVSDINISIIRSLRLCCWTTTLVVLFLVRCVLEIWCGCVWVLQVQHGYHSNPTTPKLQHTSNQEQYDQRDNSTAQSQAADDGYIMSETYWAHKKWNKIASDIKLVFYSSTIAKRATLLYWPQFCLTVLQNRTLLPPPHPVFNPPPSLSLSLSLCVSHNGFGF